MGKEEEGDEPDSDPECECVDKTGEFGVGPQCQHSSVGTCDSKGFAQADGSCVPFADGSSAHRRIPPCLTIVAAALVILFVCLFG